MFLRSTSVCKSWYKLITSPSFISLHLNLSISNTQNRVMLRFSTENDSDRYYLRRDNQAFEELQELEPPINPDSDITIHGSSNGVLCYSEDLEEQSLILWNPSLRKSLILPKYEDSSLSDNYQHVGFGFMPASDNFKIVRVIYTHSERELVVPPKVEIYEFYTGSWRNLDDAKLSYVVRNYFSQALLNGIVHWAAYDPQRVEGTCTYGGLIVSFDLESERFGDLMFPKCMQNVDGKLQLHTIVSTINEYLCLFLGGEWGCIFIMKEYGVTDSWEKVFTFDSLSFKPIYIRENGEIFGEILFYEDDESVGLNLASHDPKTNEIIGLVEHEYVQSFRDVYAYVDSLFLIKDSKKAMES